MNKTINIRIEGKYCSISDFDWHDIPPLAILTGINGSGKTQLLEVLAYTFGALPPRYPRMPMQPDLGARAIIEGRTFLSGEVFHSYGEWAELSGGGTDEKQIEDLIRRIHSEKQGNEWFWNNFAKGLGMATEDARKLSLEAFCEYLTPGLLWGHLQGQNLSTLFLAYRLFERDALARGLTERKVRELYGEPPWDLLNHILEASGLPFRVNTPEMIRPTSLLQHRHFSAGLRDVERNLEIPFNKLSSGEKVIMATALWRYGAEQFGRHYNLLLLDEPDAHLHPSLTRRFLNVIQRVFVEERGVQVIMSTHSPSTVALAPKGSLFEMRKSAPRIVPVTNKGNAIATLTGGFVAVQESTQTVLLEGKDDPPFFQLIWELLTERTAISEPGPLEPSPSIIFIYGQGKEIVKHLIPQLRSRGFLSFHGIIDGDESNTSSDGVYILNRNGMENYLFDPLNVWVFLHLENKAPAIEGITVPRGRSGYVRDLPDIQLQKIADSLFNMVERTIPDLASKETVRQAISFANGKRLQYPQWFLRRDDKKIKELFQKKFGYHLTNEKLLGSYATLNMVPTELLLVFKTIQSANRARAGE